MHMSCDGYITPCVAVRYYRDDINIKSHSYTKVIESEFLRSFKCIGNGEGCPSRCYPEKFAEWKISQKNNGRW